MRRRVPVEPLPPANVQVPPDPPPGALTSYYEHFSFETCPVCGICFAMPRHFIQSRRDGRLGVNADAAGFYCPRGHYLTYGETTLDRLRRDRDRLSQENARLAEEAAAETAKRVRIEHRVHAGVCPCCRRSFANVARHMRAQHPEVG